MTTRDSDALITAKWAETGDVATPASQGLTIANGWPSSYSTPGSGDNPEREVFNWLFRAMTAIMVELNAHGLLVWNAGLSYAHPALVFGSDGMAYISVRDSQGVNPTTDANNDDWEPFGVATTQTTTFDASAIVSGVLADARIPNLSGAKITSGTVAAARISAAIARLASPTLTGNPRSVTQAASDDDTSIATTAFTQDAIDRRQLVTTTDPTQANIDTIPNGGVILVRSTTAYSP